MSSLCEASAASERPTMRVSARYERIPGLRPYPGACIYAFVAHRAYNPNYTVLPILMLLKAKEAI